MNRVLLWVVRWQCTYQMIKMIMWRRLTTIKRHDCLFGLYQILINISYSKSLPFLIYLCVPNNYRYINCVLFLPSLRLSVVALSPVRVFFNITWNEKQIAPEAKITRSVVPWHKIVIKLEVTWTCLSKTLK